MYPKCFMLILLILTVIDNMVIHAEKLVVIALVVMSCAYLKEQHYHA